MMNCRKAEPRIPLLIEADLDAVEMQQVNAHLAACETCRLIAAEFAASQSWLHRVAAPEMDEAMLTAMRRDVLQNIAPTATRPAFVEWWQPLWTWKTVVAAAVILLAIGIAIPRRGAESGAGQVADKTNDAVSLATNKEPEDASRPTPQRFQPRMGRQHKAQGGVSVRERNPGNDVRRPSSPARAIDIDNQIAAASVAPSGANENSANLPRVDTLGFTLPPAPQAENITQSFEKSAPEPEMLRMEFQTADPNIRIIWLTPKEPARTNPATDTK